MKKTFQKTICLFTGGGVAPALNASLYGAIKKAREYGWRVLGGKFGWKSLMIGGEIIDLPPHQNFWCGDLEKIKNVGGTFLGTSRTNPLKYRDGVKQILARMKKYKIDYLLPIGGDDTLGAAKILWEKYKIPLCSIPKTIDNDLAGTYFTPGFPTAAYSLAVFTKAIVSNTKATRNKIHFIECMGGSAGWLASCGALGGADMIVIPEQKTDLKKFLRILKKKYQKNEGYAVVMLSHQANFGKKIKALYFEKKDEYGISRPLFLSLGLKKDIEKALNCEVKIAVPGNFLSAANPIPFDQKYAVLLGQKAINFLGQGKFGYMSAVQKVGSKLKIEAVPLGEIRQMPKPSKMDKTFFDFGKFYPKKKFFAYLKAILE